MKTMPATDAEAEAYSPGKSASTPTCGSFETEDRAGRHFLDRLVH